CDIALSGAVRSRAASALRFASELCASSGRPAGQLPLKKHSYFPTIRLAAASAGFFVSAISAFLAPLYAVSASRRRWAVLLSGGPGFCDVGLEDVADVASGRGK